MGSRGNTFAQRIWPKATAATAEKMVMLRAVIGFCPWATAKVVITPAPRQATVSWVRVEGRLSKFAGAGEAETTDGVGVVPAQPGGSLRPVGVRYLASWKGS